jgi:predicted nucleic acid-binding Zn ribbon protein
MATCSRCGRTTPIWQRDLFSGLCPECSRQPPADAREKITQTFKRRRSQGWVLIVTAIAVIVLGIVIDLRTLDNEGQKRSLQVPSTQPAQAVPPDAPRWLVQEQRPTTVKPHRFIREPEVQTPRIPRTSYFLIGSAVLALVLIVIHALNWRCPACGRSLGRGLNPKFCSKCGAQLQEAEKPIQGSSATAPKQGAEADGGL